MDTDDPVTQIDNWHQAAPGVMKEGIRAKFMQNKELRKFLRQTKSHCIAEASIDTFWGIGLSMDSAEKNNTKMWRGQNQLGTILCEVREELKYVSGDDNTQDQ